MAEVVYYVAASLDGYIATSDGGLEWLSPFEAAGEDYGYNDFYAGVDAIFIGRRTYELVREMPSWPYAGKPCWVFGRGTVEPLGPDVTLTGKEPGAVLAELEAQGVRRAWLVGGGRLASAFRAAGLITEYIVSVVPVILGSGIPLFDAEGPVEGLRLVESKVFPVGMVQLRYLSNRPAGE